MNRSQNNRVAAIVVTYNRLNLLKECIKSLKSQSERPDEIFVVDNDSKDGSRDWLKAQDNLTLIFQDNKGSSGGQLAGIKAAYDSGHSWFWCMDDDTIPEKNALSNFKNNRNFASNTTGFLASRVVLENGDCQKLATPVCSGDLWFNSVLKDHCVQTEKATFVSLLVNKNAVAEVGYPCGDFFILWDDTEFTKRLSTWGKSYFVLDSVVVHKTPDNGAPGYSSKGIKFKYFHRNKIIVAKLSSKDTFQKFKNVLKIILFDFWQVFSLRLSPKALFWDFVGLVTKATICFPG